MTPDEMAELLRQMHEMVGGGEPPEIATSYLAIPQDSVVRFQGSAVPILGTSMTQRPDGLILPTQTLGDRVIAMGRRYMTSLELLGRPIPPEEAGVFIGGHQPENILTACAVLMAQLYETGDPTDPLVQRHLVESYLAGGARRTAEGLLADGTWVFLASQPVLGVINVALMVGPAIVTRTADQAPRDAVIASLGLAAVLGGESPNDEKETLFGGVQRSLLVDLLANQLFNRSINLGSELARWQRTRECAIAAYPELTAAYDRVFFEATGTTPDVLFDVGFTALLKQNEIHTVVIDPSLLGQLHHPQDQVDAAVRLLATDVETLGAEVTTEVDAVGFQWAFTALRRFPMLRKENGELLILNPGFLIERICGSAFHWEVMYELNQRERSGGAARKEAKRLRGGFGGFTGHVAEEYVADRLAGIAGHNDGLAKVLWREGELQAFWPGESCCDILIDGGATWIPMEIVSHRISQGAAEGGSWQTLEKDLEAIVDKKAAQLDTTIMRLISAGGALPGYPVRTDIPRYHPVIVASNGFPWNPLMARAIHERVKELGLLQHPLIHPLTAIDTDAIEYIESAVERGLCTLEGLLGERLHRDQVSTPMDHYLNGKGRLRHPTSLRRPMLAAFQQTGGALGIDVSVLGIEDDPDEDH